MNNTPPRNLQAFLQAITSKVLHTAPDKTEEQMLSLSESDFYVLFESYKTAVGNTYLVETPQIHEDRITKKSPSKPYWLRGRW
jgi:hypothetical protein